MPWPVNGDCEGTSSSPLFNDLMFRAIIIPSTVSLSHNYDSTRRTSQNSFPTEYCKSAAYGRLEFFAQM